MWNRLKKLVSGTTTDPASAKPTGPSPAPPSEPSSPKLDFEFEKSRPEVEAFLKIDIANEKAESERGELAQSVMKNMARDIDQIERAAKGNPENTIEGSLWLSGAGYGNLARELTTRFRDAGWLAHEQMASALWARATLAVNARFHHLVGPAMLANAGCQQRLGNPDRATYIYTSVLKDFIFLIATWRQKTQAPADDDKIAIECLQTAVEKLLALGSTEIESTDLKASRQHIYEILDRPTTDG